ncbi:hypothetical protein MNBD_BACTEROID01-1122 [hydrothermal vent metagenome]|uniref:Lipoprotein SmpA/OmlA domain-containing protein n=1 Tax=hydrothermal vent metagenome TaxID=652676 RepID=A0A3B0UKK5_9ZZZZ
MNRKIKPLKYLAIILTPLVLCSCSPYSYLKKLKGENAVRIIEKLGRPDMVIPRKTDSLYIYLKETELRSTEISQGKLTLDPMVSPGVTKTERYTFTISNGIVTNVKRIIEYER